MPTLETRIISGKGVLKIDPEAVKKVKRITLFADVIRFPKQDYYSSKYNPNRSFYATLNFIRNDYVIHEEVLHYANQSWEFAPQEEYQLLYAVKCAFKETLNGLTQIAAALAFTLDVTNHLEDWKHTNLFWDTVTVVCHADTAIRLVAESEEYLLCAEDEDVTPNEPPPVPDAPPSVPPGVPLDDDTTPVSPPYDGTDDGGDTVPYPGDSPPPPSPLEPPFGTTGEFYTISFTYDRIRPEGVIYDTQYVSFVHVPAPIQDYGISDDMTAYGSAAPGGYAIGTNPSTSAPVYLTNGLGFVGFSTCANIRDIVTTLE